MAALGSARALRSRRAKWGIVLAIVLGAAFWFHASVSDVFGKQYEYEEDLVIRLDGSATITVNASIPALVALRGLDLNPLSETVDRDRVRASYESNVTRVLSVPRPWRRQGRQFVQIKLEVPDIRRLHEAAPFSWSRYELLSQNGRHIFRQTIGPSALKRGSLQNVGWSGGEIVAFRVHFPSRILDHNARDLENDEPTGVSRGNILAWEQHLADRLDGREVKAEVQMESRSILYRTLWLFVGAFLAAVLTLAGMVLWFVRRGKGSGG